jgi:membrane protease YdiL (CAAX protease family)
VKDAGEGPLETYSYKPAAYFLLAFALTWLPWFASARFSYAPNLVVYQYGSLLLGGFGPLLAALFLIRTSGSDALKQDFRARLIDVRKFNPPYLLVTFLLMPLVTWVAVRLSLHLGQPASQLALSSNLLARVPITLIAPTLEELGWRGYGMDSLRAKFGALGASLLFGILWALWHWPLFLINGTYQHDLLASPLYTANFFASVLPIAIIANWLYYKHRRLILAAILFHFMLDAVPQSFAIDQATKCIETVLFAIIAIAIVAIDRKVFGGREGQTFLVPATGVA